ncbi:unnamed protein product [Dovyalis caffra]|uniref:Uncharacterized protein n=1 Tax=Dovyalis caffra TaxID=77055 RepID=A0AAV1R587_9ROSI|nr:unnamed protein product [Dovyalis caffra]
MIRPAKDSPEERLWLSNLDLVQPRLHLPTVYLYKPIDSSNFFEAQVLKEALSKVLVPFYPMAGRLGKDENGRIEINCNGEGVLFVEAETNIALSDLGEFIPVLQLQQLIPTVDYSGDISSYPLFVLQVTRFTCGGVCLGVGFLHTVGDGGGAIHLINTWSDLARGLSMTTPPFTNRTMLSARVPTNPKFHHIEYDPHPTMNSHDPTTPTQQKPSSSMANLKITLDLMNALKSKTTENNESKTKYSSFEVLTAHIWRCTCKARGLPDAQATKLCIPTDGRSRFHPPLPSNYFGNVVFHATPIALSGDLLSEPFAATAERIHQAIKRMDDEYLRSVIDYMEEVGDLKQITQGIRLYECPNLKINSWLRLPFYKADFGWGAPLLIRPAIASDGKAVMYPGPVNDGSFFLAIGLGTNHVKSFEKLFYDLDH